MFNTPTHLNINKLVVNEGFTSENVNIHIVQNSEEGIKTIKKHTSSNQMINLTANQLNISTNPITVSNLKHGASSDNRTFDRRLTM